MQNGQQARKQQIGDVTPDLALNYTLEESAVARWLKQCRNRNDRECSGGFVRCDRSYWA